MRRDIAIAWVLVVKTRCDLRRLNFGLCGFTPIFSRYDQVMVRLTAKLLLQTPQVSNLSLVCVVHLCALKSSNVFPRVLSLFAITDLTLSRLFKLWFFVWENTLLPCFLLSLFALHRIDQSGWTHGHFLIMSVSVFLANFTIIFMSLVVLLDTHRAELVQIQKWRLKNCGC